MNRMRWAAWGVIDIETLDRMQRRNYINSARKELEQHKVKLDCGGSTRVPWYSVAYPKGDTIKRQSFGGKDAFKKVSAWLLQELGDHERSEDGGVRSAGV